MVDRKIACARCEQRRDARCERAERGEGPPVYSAEVSAAIFRRQSRHRQSLPSDGIGSRTVSSVHQHGPLRLQVNSVPQPEQARRRDAELSKKLGLSERFVMKQSLPRR